MKSLLITACIIGTSTSLGATLNRIEATVNSNLVLLSDVAKFKKTLPLRAQLDPLFSGTELAKKGEQAKNKEIVQALINEKIILSEFPVSESEIDNQINSIQASNRITRGTLKRALAEKGFNFEDYKKLIKTSLSKKKLIDRDIRTRVNITDDDIKNFFYNEYQGRGKKNLTYRIRLLSISRETYKTKKDALAAINRAKAAATAGEDFTEIVKRMSDGPNTNEGGDLGFLSESELSPIIRKSVKKLKVKEVSPIITASDGSYLLVQLDDVQSGQDDELKKMSNQIREVLSAREYQRQIQLWIERHRDDSYIHLARVKK